ncbi:hypothetical protein HQQ80_05490 [Microbacteriaceae bacterium VKM Ac-2855]|nr:hypothetical protein [Microbacteriaceae bacterium VKM Ac-2855]
MTVNEERRDAIVPALLLPAGLYPVLNAVAGADEGWPAWRIASLGIGATIVTTALILLIRACIRPKVIAESGGDDAAGDTP